MNWMDVLKLDQVNIGSSVLDTRELPEEKEERDCCQEAKDTYKRHHAKSRFRDYDENKDVIEQYDWMYTGDWQRSRGELGGFANKSCEKFREFLEDGPTTPTSTYRKILMEWNKCEGRD